VEQQLRAVVQQLLSTASIGQADVTAVLLDGLLAADSNLTWPLKQTLARLGLESKTASGGAAVVAAAVGDAASGASLLSAAELDSSKQYLQLDEGWKIAHLLPVADGALLGGGVGLRVLWDEAQAAAQSEADVQVVCLRDARLWKEDLGPIPPRAFAAPRSITKGFKWGSRVATGAGEGGGHANDTSPSQPVGAYPRVQLLQRLGGQWRSLKTLSPLAPPSEVEAGGAGVGVKEVLESCELRVTVDAATGALGLQQTRGLTVSESRTALLRRVGLICVLLLPFLLVGLFYFGTQAQGWYATRQHSLWLTEFYAQHAPEKLKDPAYVARTVHKYRGKMFLLWRGLERTYDVKWPAPHSILDTGSMASEL